VEENSESVINVHRRFCNPVLVVQRMLLGAGEGNEARS
jgi:hypothetical protein